MRVGVQFDAHNITSYSVKFEFLYVKHENSKKPTFDTKMADKS